ncbi:porin [Pseudovibrio sp. SCP19]|uniref:porin n=1 Tax=Pseudovibrio sp. SCP19 TaxID=3141374 RepID=UPI0033352578
MNFKKLAIAASAAAAATPAMAADLPVVAEPVEYVEVCSAAGAGYFKLPGKDVCLSISGKTRVTLTSHDLTESYDDTQTIANAGAWNEEVSYANAHSAKAEGFVYFDAVAFTEFATIKTHTEFEAEWNDLGEKTISTGNTYVQLGFDNVTVTAGRTGSAWTQFGGFSSIGVIGISSGGEDGLGVNVAASLGNGFTAEFAVEDANAYFDAKTASKELNYIATLGVAQGMFSANLSAASFAYAQDERGFAVSGSAEIAATDKVTFGLGAAYAADALTLIDAAGGDVTQGDDARGFVVGAGVKVAMTDMLTGALDASYASTEDDNNDEFSKTVVNGSLTYSPVAGLSMILDAGWARSEANNVDSDEAKIATRLQYSF